VSKAVWCALLAATLVAVPQVGLAQEGAAGGLKPLVTVAFSGYDELLADIDFIGKLAGNPNLSKMAEAGVTLATRGQGLVGLDTKRPWGVVVRTDGQQFPVLVYLPVSDYKKLLDLLGQQGMELKAAGGGVTEIATPARPVFVAEKGGWAIAADSPTALAGAAADPLALLGDLPKNYDLAIRASVKNIPEVFRNMFVGQFLKGATEGMGRMPNESDEDFTLRTGVAKQMIEQVRLAINQLDDLLLGLNIDRSAGTAHLDVEVTAQPNTKLAAQFAQMKDTESNFAGFDLSGAAVTANWAGTLSEGQIAQAKGNLAALRERVQKQLKSQGLGAEREKLATELLTDLLQVVEETIEKGKNDGGMVLLLEPGAVNLAVGSIIANPPKLEAVVKRLVAEISKEEPEVGKLIKLDAEQYQGIRFHTATIPVQDENAAKAVGKTVEVVVGIGEGSVYFAAGSSSATVLKQAIDKSKASAGKQVAPVRVVVALTPIARFVSQVADDARAKNVAAFMAGILQQAEGKDHVILVTKPIPNGSRTRLELEQGVLKAIGSLGQMAGGGAGNR